MAECPICKIKFNKNDENKKAFILQCGDSACSRCIKFYKEANKQIECGKCCRQTQSLGVENNSLYSKDSEENNNSPAPNVEKGEFEIYIRKKNSQEKFAVLVNKLMTIKQLKDLIKVKHNIEPDTYELAFKKPMIKENKTLESFQVTKTVTITMVSIVEGGN